MKQVVFGDSVQGASHKRTGKECQDSYKRIERNDGTVILAVADGHGSDSCPYSKTGSSIAVNVFCKVMDDLFTGFAESPEMLLSYLNREADTKIAHQIDDDWKRRVLKVHTNNKREVTHLEDGTKDKVAIYKAYGSTLVGMVIAPTFVFALQIGDGDMIYVDSSGVEQVLQSDKILGTETHSLSKVDAWKKAVSVVRRRNVDDSLPCLFMLSTDGFSNSYKNEGEFHRTCLEYYSMINEHGAKAVDDNLRCWLSETSEMGCGDDITLLMAYYAAEVETMESECTNEEP